LHYSMRDMDTVGREREKNTRFCDDGVSLAVEVELNGTDFTF